MSRPRGPNICCCPHHCPAPPGGRGHVGPLWRKLAVMMTADLGACEWFVWDLRRSSLVERGRLEQLVAEYLMRHPTAEPGELGNYLVEQGVLTRFQCDSLLNGKSQGLVLGPFIVHEELGKGTMGTVYKAKSKLNNEWYAVKVLPRRSMWN